MFGTQKDFDNRIAEYRRNSVGIKHLHRLSPLLSDLLRPQPNQPINLHVTTSGGVAYDSVRCWVAADGGESTFELVSSGSVWNALEWRYVHHWHGQIPPPTQRRNSALPDRRTCCRFGKFDSKFWKPPSVAKMDFCG